MVSSRRFIQEKCSNEKDVILASVRESLPIGIEDERLVLLPSLHHGINLPKSFLPYPMDSYDFSSFVGAVDGVIGYYESGSLSLINPVAGVRVLVNNPNPNPNGENPMGFGFGSLAPGNFIFILLYKSIIQKYILPNGQWEELPAILNGEEGRTLGNEYLFSPWDHQRLPVRACHTASNLVWPSMKSTNGGRRFTLISFNLNDNSLLAVMPQSLNGNDQLIENFCKLKLYSRGGTRLSIVAEGRPVILQPGIRIPRLVWSCTKWDARYWELKMILRRPDEWLIGFESRSCNIITTNKSGKKFICGQAVDGSTAAMIWHTGCPLSHVLDDRFKPSLHLLNLHED